MLIDKIKKYPRDVITDERGWFLKIMTGTEEFSNNICEIYFTSAHKNQSKGSHFHNKAREWFTLIEGKAILKLEDIVTHEKLSIKLDANKPETIYIPPYIAHCIDNKIEQDYILCAYTDKKYIPSDTVAYIID